MTIGCLDEGRGAMSEFRVSRRELVIALSATALTSCAVGDSRGAGGSRGTGGSQDTEDPCTGKVSSGRLSAPLRKDQVLRLPIDQPSTAGPGPGFDSGLGLITHLCFNGLYVLGPDRKVMPADAASYEPSADLLTHVFRLRTDLSWSDGTPLTARDYEWSWKTQVARSGLLPDPVLAGATELATGQGSAEDLGVTALDDATLQIITAEPCPYMLDMLAGRIWARPVPQHVIEAHGDSWAEFPHWTGNGPFVLAEWKRNVSMVLERREDFVGPRPTLQRIELTIVDDPIGDTALRSFRAGELDYAVVPPPEVDNTRCSVAADQQVTTAWPYLTMIVPNAATKPLDDVRVRRALYLAIDRDELVTLARGLGRPAYSVLAPEMREGSPGGRKPDFANVGDAPAEARRLLAEAGFPDGKGFPSMEYLALAGTTGTSEVEAVGARWKAVLGIDISIRPMDQASWAGAVLGSDAQNWGALADGIWPSDYPDPAEILGPLLALGGAIYHHNVELDAAVQAQFAEALNATEGRGAKLAELDLAIMQDVPVIPLAFGEQLAVRQPGVEAEAFYYGADFQRLRYATLHEADE
jgi:oligopeptide transport system substrate-binding protein